jgi:AcrR family transcriptional regulator
MIPTTRRGQQTRAALVEAAAEVFAEKQFLATNVTDIATRAGTAHGTFYRYFDSKEEIFREVALDLQRKMRAHGEADRTTEPPPFDSLDDELLWRITRANRRYLAAYQEHAALFAVIEQVATFNDELLAIRKEIRRGFVDHARASIERMQREGLVFDDVDPHYAASALGSMVDRFAYVWLVLHEPFELDEAARTLGLLWARSLGLGLGPGAGAPRSA